MPSLSAATAPGWSPAASNSDTILKGMLFRAIADRLYRRGVTSRPGMVASGPAVAWRRRNSRCGGHSPPVPPRAGRPGGTPGPRGTPRSPEDGSSPPRSRLGEWRSIVYTGLITEVGAVVDLDPDGVVVAGPKTAAGLRPGGSVDVSGVCLT